MFIDIDKDINEPTLCKILGPHPSCLIILNIGVGWSQNLAKRFFALFCQ